MILPTKAMLRAVSLEGVYIEPQLSQRPLFRPALLTWSQEDAHTEKHPQSMETTRGALHQHYIHPESTYQTL